MLRKRLNKRQLDLALRFFTYGIMTLATIILTMLAILYAMGYRFSQDGHGFTQGGLIQFHSFPSGGTVKLDGKVQSFKTPGRVNVTAGTHNVAIELQGFRVWSKTISINPGQLLWLNYARLAPNTITTNNLKTFNTLAGSMASPDKRKILLQLRANSPAFVVADLSNEDTPKFTDISVPADVFSKKDKKLGKISIVEWDLDSKFVLLRHQVGKVSEYIRFEVERPQEAVNISEIFKFNIANAQFAGSSANVVFVNADGVLRRLDIRAKSASGALVDGLRSFVVYSGDDIVVFNAVKDGQQRVGTYTRDGVENVYRQMAPNNHISIAYAEYFNESYVAIRNGKTVDILNVSSEAANLTTTLNTISFDQTIDRIDFSNSGRMFIAVSGTNIKSYDIELGETYNYKVDSIKGLDWLDDFYLFTEGDDQLRIFEFDGKNQQDIVSVAAGYPVNLSRNGKYIYSVARTDGKLVLQASKMTTE